MRVSWKPIAGGLMPAALLVCIAACSGGGASAQGNAGMSASPTPAVATTPAGATTPAPVMTPPAANAAFVLPPGFAMSTIATVDSPRELAMLPNGDLLVGSSASSVLLVPNADGPGVSGTPVNFGTPSENGPEGVAYAGGFIYAATEHHLFRTSYASGDRTAHGFTAIANFRSGNPTPGSDGDVHTSSSVAVSSTHVYIGIGSGCNACVETDPTRATIQVAALDGSSMTTRATRIRNAVALAIDPSGALWAGGAGQDALPTAHPYEYFDDVDSHSGIADYGWPACEENHVAYTSGANCGATVAPIAELPAYSTLIGAVFYPANPAGAYAFPAAYRGGIFVTAHGSWHVVNGHHIPPRVAFIAMSGSHPATAVNWNDAAAQWTDFVGGWQDNASGDTRAGRPTGIAVGPNGSLFIADDQTGAIYRIRPSGSSSAPQARR